MGETQSLLGGSRAQGEEVLALWLCQGWGGLAGHLALLGRG